jgi:ubiquinone/menaquinone biosynthesis C-methylase UbiE
MSLDIRRLAEMNAQELAELDGAMSAFYRNPPPEYYRIADESAGQYNVKQRPFHCDLVHHVQPGQSVLELGCGTAHLCPYIEERGATYTGADHSEGLLEENRRRFPKACFRLVTALGDGEFDVVASLYTIEHVVDPRAYLERMWRLCRSGGSIAILCPEFVDCPDFPPSFFYGKTPRRLREKLQSLSLLDAAQHLLDVKVRGRDWKNRARDCPPGAFWINMRPRVLQRVSYCIDSDAVHLVTRRDLVWFFQQKGAEVLRTSADMCDVAPEILRYNCYVLVRKPVSSAPSNAASAACVS